MSQPDLSAKLDVSYPSSVSQVLKVVLPVIATSIDKKLPQHQLLQRPISGFPRLCQLPFQYGHGTDRNRCWEGVCAFQSQRLFLKINRRKKINRQAGDTDIGEGHERRRWAGRRVRSGRGRCSSRRVWIQRRWCQRLSSVSPIAWGRCWSLFAGFESARSRSPSWLQICFRRRLGSW